MEEITESTILNIPFEILSVILSFISEKKHWLSVKLVCKHFLLISIKAFDPSVDNNWAIKWVSRKGHLEVVRLLLEDSRVDPSVDNNCAIQLASKNGHLEVVSLLLKDSRVDPYDNYNWAIQLASKNGHLEVVSLLLEDSRVKSTYDSTY